MEYSDSAIFGYSPQQVFDVVADIEKYPEFLPGWITVEVLDRQTNSITVEQELGFTFLNWRFTSHATLEPPFHIHITSVKGPFLNLVIDWAFYPTDNKTRVSIVAKTESLPGPQHRFMHGIFSNSTRTLLDRFKDRVQQIYSNGEDEKQ
ncbi:type II toxin-antitoxin system RatA family toxin [Kaarinaea lacus]